VIAAELECTVSSHLELKMLGEAGARLNRAARVQIKIDTGMGRLGVLMGKAAEFVWEAVRQPHVQIAGVYTHFATADEPDVGFACEQLGMLLQLREALRAGGCRIGCFHAANSAAIYCVPGCDLDMVRPGLAIYGYWGGHPDGRPKELRPILRVFSRIVSLRRLPSGAGIGYGRTFRTSRESSIGVVPIGYADGYRRSLSNAGVMTLEARRGSPRQAVNVVGRVSMDLVSVDLTGVPDVRVGDSITVLDDAPEAPNSVESIARQLGTIPYEITCAIGPRIERIPQTEWDLRSRRM
jgi:alanine racemase